MSPLMPPTKFRLNLTCSGADVVWKWLPWRTSWISKPKDFSSSESLCLSDTFNQVSAKTDKVWEEMWFEEFQDGGHAALGYQNGTILAIKVKMLKFSKGHNSGKHFWNFFKS